MNKTDIDEARGKAFMIQKQVMENSRNINEYYKDFEAWVTEMNNKDKIISNIKSKEPEKEIIKNDENEKQLNLEKIRKAKELAKANKLKRDGNSIKDYYDNWDRVNADDELIDVESRINMNTPTTKELYDEKKKI